MNITIKYYFHQVNIKTKTYSSECIILPRVGDIVRLVKDDGLVGTVIKVEHFIDKEPKETVVSVKCD